MKVENLMNLVMQLRKVCNHPELFERRPARSPYSFQELTFYTGHIPMRSGEIKYICSSLKNPIYFGLPRLVYDEILRFPERREHMSKRLLNIYSVRNQTNNPTFSSLQMTNLTMSEVLFCFREDPLWTGVLLAHWWHRSNYSATLSTHQKMHINYSLTSPADYRFILNRQNQVPSLEMTYMPSATAPLIELSCDSIAYREENELLNNNKFHKFLLEGRYSEEFYSYFGQNPP